MRNLLVIISLTAFSQFVFVHQIKAQANNRFGVHILNPQEIQTASQIVNGNGGEWGYVTIPIPANDRDLLKWQRFMDDATKFHVIPIIRIAGIPRGDTWLKPTFDEVIDFSNFLNDLKWPTEIKHVIIFNEPNHSSEWGNEVKPDEYAAILNFAIYRFNLIDPNFLVLPAALDASAPDSKTSMSEYKYFRRMFSAFPKLASSLEALNSHSYPNPNFSGKPTDKGNKSVATFLHELKFLSAFTQTELPVFITETGWQMETLSPVLVAQNYKESFSGIWNDPRVMAVTPFLLSAVGEPFQKFSLLTPDHALTEPAKILSNLPKNSGQPAIALKEESQPSPNSVVLGKTTAQSHPTKTLGSLFTSIKSVFLKLNGKSEIVIKDMKIRVEIADNSRERARGLSFRKNLGLTSGMLFEFESPGIYKFWMKDMYFPLDFVWIRNNYVVDLTRNVPNPKSGQSPEVITPKTDVDKVLEINSGLIDVHNIQIGDKIENI